MSASPASIVISIGRGGDSRSTGRVGWILDIGPFTGIDDCGILVLRTPLEKKGTTVDLGNAPHRVVSTARLSRINYGHCWSKNFRRGEGTHWVWWSPPPRLGACLGESRSDKQERRYKQHESSGAYPPSGK